MAKYLQIWPQKLNSDNSIVETEQKDAKLTLTKIKVNLRLVLFYISDKYGADSVWKSVIRYNQQHIY